MRYKTRQPYKVPEKALDFDSLVSSGNEISINQRIDIYMGNDPDFESISLLNAVSNDYTKLLIPKVDWDNFNYDQILHVGDIINIAYDDGTPVDPATLHRNCIKSITNDSTTVYVELMERVSNLPGAIKVSRELIFRVSNLNCYRVDEWGFGRSYTATAELSSIETDLGDLFDPEYKTGDYTFQVQNYDGFYDQYLPGGSKKISWAGCLVKVWLGCGEEAIKNVLIWEGITHFDSGVNESNKKLQINAYHVSYIYNKEINKARFKNVLDKDYENKVIPTIFGDYTTPMRIGTKTYPSIPAVLVSSTPSGFPAKARILASKTKADTLVITAASLGVGPGGNGYIFKVNFYDYFQLPSWDKSGSITYDSGTKTTTINCYAGKDTSGVLYSSSLYIKQRIESLFPVNGYFSVTGGSNIPMVDFYEIQNYNQSHSQYSAQTTAQPRHMIEVTSSGGVNTVDLEYKICSNPLDASLEDFDAWFCKGSPDEEKNWAASNYTIATYPLGWEWDAQNGRILFFDVPTTDPDLVVTDWKLFVAVKSSVGLVYQPTFYPQVNIANNKRSLWANKTPLSMGSRNDPFGKAIATRYEDRPAFTFGEAYRANHMQYYGVNKKKTKYVSQTFLGVEYNSYPVTTTYTEWYIGYSTPYTTFQPTEFRHDKDFVAEVELCTELPHTPESKYGSVPNHVQCIFSLKDSTSEVLSLVLRNNYLTVFFNNRTKTVRATDGQLSINTNYKVRIKKTANVIRIYYKNLDTAGAWTEVGYDVQNTWASGDNKKAFKCEVGYSQNNTNTNYPADWNWFMGLFGSIRIANEHDAFETTELIDLVNPPLANDPASIAEEILQLGGVPGSRFDYTISIVSRTYLPTALQYKARVYLNEEGKKAVEAAQEFLAQFGMILTMNSIENKMKFCIVYDSPEMYRYANSMYQINDDDIERDSIETDREVNKYFNSAFAKFDYAPALDDFNRTSKPYYEPAALKRDAGVQHWYRLEEKDRLSFELPALYQVSDVENRIKDALAISTPDTEIITLNASFRFLLLTVGSFVFLNVDRYKNVPCMVRAVTIDPNSSSVKVKLMSLENVRYTDRVTGLTFTPSPNDGIGGLPAKANIVSYTDNDDV